MSDFVDGNLNSSDGIDFNKAQKLPGGGSTCDIYKAISQRRKVFVKRLKQNLRNKPLYLAAFDKEYDIGVNLNHPSLPNYREFHGDYIVMDFIDGKTLAERIKEKDQWLSKEKNVVKILRQLVNVIDYLHQHHVAHCDIKPDNIMITAGNRDMMLIDLDKCYTDWLDDTPGSPSKFGLEMERKGDMTMDYYCVALVLEKIKSEFPEVHINRFGEIIKACKNENANAQDILEIIDSKPISKRKNWLYGLGCIVICGLLALIIVNQQTKREFEDELIQTETIKPDVNQDTIAVIEKTQNKPSEKEPPIIKNINEIPTSQITKPVVYTDEEKGEILDKNFQPMFNRLHAGLTELQTIQQDTSLSWVNMLDKIQDFVDIEQSTIERAFGLISELFPDTEPTEVFQIMSHSKVYINYMHRADSIQKIYAVEMDKRREARK